MKYALLLLDLAAIMYTWNISILSWNSALMKFDTIFGSISLCIHLKAWLHWTPLKEIEKFAFILVDRTHYQTIFYEAWYVLRSAILSVVNLFREKHFKSLKWEICIFVQWKTLLKLEMEKEAKYLSQHLMKNKQRNKQKTAWHKNYQNLTTKNMP